MKKELILVGAAFAAVILTGCAGITTNNGGIAPIAAGPVFFADVKANAIIPQYAPAGAKVVKRNVTAEATLQSFFTCITMGDVSYETLKKEALKQAPGAEDLTDVKIDYTQKTICGINTVTAKLTATAIKF